MRCVNALKLFLIGLPRNKNLSGLKSNFLGVGEGAVCRSCVSQKPFDGDSNRTVTVVWVSDSARGCDGVARR